MADIDTLQTLLRLKDETRTGWDLRNIQDPEHVADHSWGTALLVLLYADQANINTDKAVKMAIVHDIGEAETGDIATRANAEKQRMSSEKKQQEEQTAVANMMQRLGRDDLFTLWKEYEARETAEAQFVKDMDLIDMCLQALIYERQERYDPDEDNEHFEEYEHLDEFFATTEPRLRTEVGKTCFEEIKEAYNEEKTG